MSLNFADLGSSNMLQGVPAKIISAGKPGGTQCPPMDVIAGWLGNERILAEFHGMSTRKGILPVTGLGYSGVLADTGASISDSLVSTRVRNLIDAGIGVTGPGSGFEGGSNGAQAFGASAANEIVWTASSTPASLVVSTDFARHGSQSLKLSLINGVNPIIYVGNQGLGNLTAAFYSRFYFMMPTNCTTSVRLARWNDSGGSQLICIGLQSGGPNLALRDGGNTVVASTGTIPTGQWMRVEMYCLPGATTGQGQMKVWWTNPESTGTPDYDSGVLTNLSLRAALDQFWFGAPGAATTSATWNAYFDDLAYLAPSYPGPSPISDSVSVYIPRSITDTGASITDSAGVVRTPRVADTGASISDSLTAAHAPGVFDFAVGTQGPQNNFEGGSNGQQALQANTGGAGNTAFNAINAATQALLSNTVAHSGTLSFAVTQFNTGILAVYTGYTGLGSVTNAMYGRVYLYFTAYVTQNSQFIQYRDFSNAQSFAITTSTTGQILVRNSANSVVATISGSATPLNQWIRVEWMVLPDVSAGQAQVKAWFAADSVGTPDLDSGLLTGLALGANHDRFRVGLTAAPNAYSADWTGYFDDAAWMAPAWCGPTARINDVVVSTYTPGSVSYTRSITDTGASISDSIGRQITRPITDTGASISDSIGKQITRAVADTGASISDSIGPRQIVRSITDTGASITDSVGARQIVRKITDTGATITDTPGRAVSRPITDTGASISDSLASRQIVRAITDTGASISDSLTSRQIVRSITDTGASISDALVSGRTRTLFDFATGAQGPQNNFEGGSNGAQVQAANTGGANNTPTNVINFATQTLLSNVSPHSGSLCASITELNGGSSIVDFGRSGLGSLTGAVYGRAYIRMPTLPTSGIKLVRGIDSGGSQAWTIATSAGGQIQLKDAANSQFTSHTNTFGNTTGWMRLEWMTNASAGTMQVKLWYTNPESTGTPDYDSGLQTGLTIGSNLDQITFGICSAPTAFTADFTYYFDDVAWNAPIWCGPTGGINDALGVQQLTRSITDTGASISDSLGVRRIVRGISDTGASISDSIVRSIISTLVDNGVQATVLSDTYNRTVTGSGGGSWGQNDGGALSGTRALTYATLNGSPVMGVDGSKGYITNVAAGSSRRGQKIDPGSLGSLDGEQLVLVSADAVPVTSGATIRMSAGFRVTAQTDHYHAGITVSDAGVVKLRVTGVVGAVATNLASDVQVGTGYTAGDEWYVRVRYVGSHIQARAWKLGAGEPTTWQIDVTDSTVASVTAAAPNGQGNGTQTNQINMQWDSWTLFLASGVLDIPGTVVSRPLADTGATITDSLGARQIVRAVSDTGATITDSITKIVKHGVTDTGAAITDSISAVKSLAVAAVEDTIATVSSSDEFGDTVSSGWAADDQGNTWMTLGNGTASKDGTKGIMTVTGSAGQNVREMLDVSDLDFDTAVRVNLPVLSASGSAVFDLLLRNDTNYYRARSSISVGGGVTLSLASITGSTTVLGTVSAGSLSTSSWYWLRARAVGTDIRMKWWLDGTQEPPTWQIAVSDSSVLTPGSAGVRFTAGNTTPISGYVNAWKLLIPVGADDSVSTGTAARNPTLYDTGYAGASLSRLLPAAGTGVATGLSRQAMTRPKTLDKASILSEPVTLGFTPRFTHTIYNFFTDGINVGHGDTVPIGPDEQWAINNGMTPIINLGGRIGGTASDFPGWGTTTPSQVYPLYTQYAGDAGLIDIAAGVYDSQIKAWAAAVRAIGSDVWIRLWREPNVGNGTGGIDFSGHAWSTGTPANYIAAYQRVWKIFFGNQATWTAAGISGTPNPLMNAKMIWCVGTSSWFDGTGANANSYLQILRYPGDAYTDVLAADGYSGNSWDSNDFLKHFKNGPTGATGVGWYDWAKGRGIPLMIAETGATPDPAGVADAAWIATMLAGLKAMPEVRAVNLWTGGTGYPVVTSDGASASAQSAWQTVFTDPYMLKGPQTDSIGRFSPVRTITDTGASISDSPTKIFLRSLADTGATITDSVVRTAPAQSALVTDDLINYVGSTDSFLGDPDLYSWNQDDQGQDWSTKGSGTIALALTGTAGTITAAQPTPAASVTDLVLATPISFDGEVLASFDVPSPSPTGTLSFGVVMRNISSGGANRVRFTFTWNAGGTNNPGLLIQSSVAGVSTTLASGSGMGIAVGQKWWIRARAIGQNYYVKAWLDGTGEPTNWTLTALNQTPVMGLAGQAGFWIGTGSANTAGETYTFTVHSFRLLQGLGDATFPGVTVTPKLAPRLIDYTYLNPDWSSSRGGAWWMFTTRSGNYPLSDKQSDFVDTENLLGRKADAHMRYYKIGSIATDASNEYWSLITRGNKFGYISYGGSLASQGYTTGVENGSLDSQIIADMTTLNNLQSRFFIRFGWEMNLLHSQFNRSQVGGSDGTSFIRAWQRIWTILFGDQFAWTNAGISGTPLQFSHDRFKMMWCPGRGNSTSDDPAIYWPGDSYVDWIATDAYPQPYSPFADFNALMTTVNDGVARDWYDTWKQKNKPMMVGEFGFLPADKYTAGGAITDRATQWATLLAQIQTNFPQIKAISYFNGSPSSSQPWYFNYDDGSSDTPAASIAAASAAVNDKRLNPPLNTDVLAAGRIKFGTLVDTGAAISDSIAVSRAPNARTVADIGASISDTLKRVLAPLTVQDAAVAKAKHGVSYLIINRSDGTNNGGPFDPWGGPGTNGPGGTNVFTDSKIDSSLISVWCSADNILLDSIGTLGWGDSTNLSDPALGKWYWMAEMAHKTGQKIIFRMPAGHWSPSWWYSTLIDAGLTHNGDGVTPWALPIMWDPAYRTRLQQWINAAAAFWGGNLSDGTPRMSLLAGVVCDAASDIGSEWPTGQELKGVNAAQMGHNVDLYKSLALNGDGTTFNKATPPASGTYLTDPTQYYPWLAAAYAEQWWWGAGAFLTAFPTVPILMSGGQMFQDADADELSWTGSLNRYGGANAGRLIFYRTNHHVTNPSNDGVTFVGYGQDSTEALTYNGDLPSINQVRAHGGKYGFQSGDTSTGGIFPQPSFGTGGSYTPSILNDLMVNFRDAMFYEASDGAFRHTDARAALQLYDAVIGAQDSLSTVQRIRSLIDTGATISDSTRRLFIRHLVDTGATISDTLFAVRSILGNAVAHAIQTGIESLTDAGANVADVILSFVSSTVVGGIASAQASMSGSQALADTKTNSAHADFTLSIGAISNAPASGTNIALVINDGSQAFSGDTGTATATVAGSGVGTVGDSAINVATASFSGVSTNTTAGMNIATAVFSALQAFTDQGQSTATANFAQSNSDRYDVGTTASLASQTGSFVVGDSAVNAAIASMTSTQSLTDSGLAVAHATQTSVLANIDAGTVVANAILSGVQALADSATCTSVASFTALQTLTDVGRVIAQAIISGNDAKRDIGLVTAQAVFTQVVGPIDAGMSTATVIISGVAGVAQTGTSSAVGVISGVEKFIDTGTCMAVVSASALAGKQDAGTCVALAVQSGSFVQQDIGSVVASAILSGIDSPADHGTQISHVIVTGAEALQQISTVIAKAIIVGDQALAAQGINAARAIITDMFVWPDSGVNTALAIHTGVYNLDLVIKGLVRIMDVVEAFVAIDDARVDSSSIADTSGLGNVRVGDE